eukprot:Nitzschia sp. Nitz4//scaffold380_size13111//416//2129//NITZ4_008980-RA/size13111-augustus-gene-0.38-mRNA-1//-1//CDS//3329549873//3156//frame0
MSDPDPTPPPPPTPSPRPFDALKQGSDVGKDISDFLEREVFNRKKFHPDAPDSYDAEAVNRMTHKEEPSVSEQNKSQLSSLVQMFQGLMDSKGSDTSGTTKAASILDVAKKFNPPDHGTNADQDMDLVWSLLQKAIEQWEAVAKDTTVKEIDPFAFLYYVGVDEAQKTPSYKRRGHRFYPSLEPEALYDLHDGLYLATISYMHKVDDITEALEAFHGSPWVMVYCDVSSKPGQPAHYICLKREQERVEERAFRFPWESERALDVLLVVRGTKEIPDVLSDALIQAETFRDGSVHGGIYTSGKYLVDKHTPLLKELLKESKRDKIRLSLIGHSLGAGAAAIACMEFNNLPFVEAKAVGFGCPPVLSKNLSESTKDCITTVICDADVVPRMSGATIANLVANVMSVSYTDMAVQDVEQIIQAVEENTFIKLSKEQKEGMIGYVRKELDEDFENHKVVDYEPKEVVLFPPGKCIHLYRDGVGVSGSYVPCTFFREIDICRTMVADHTTAGGYDALMCKMMRDHLKQQNFKFRHDLGIVDNKC